MGTQNGGLGLRQGGQVEELATQEAEQPDVVWHWTRRGRDRRNKGHILDSCLRPSALAESGDTSPAF